NAALVEQAAAAAGSLQDQAGRLSELVSVFKLERVHAAAQAAPVAARSAALSPKPQARPQPKPAVRTTAAAPALPP
ncbi:methyl-accepting chemotaxis protein, partial [Acinetobacter baumannii]